MKRLIVPAIGLWFLLMLGGLILSSNDPLRDSAVSQLLEPPQQTVQNPYQNGYFYLLGLAATPPHDPAKAGYEIWVESATGSLQPGRNDQSTGNPAFMTPVSVDVTATVWDAEQLVTWARKTDRTIQTALTNNRLLLARYDQWLGLTFEDWGFGRRVTPHYPDIMALHRLYVVEGFLLGSQEGFSRLSKDLVAWRKVLREAKTIGTKLFAQVVISDDLRLFSQMLANPNVDQAVLTMGLQLMVPLSRSEYSLRWPIRNQFALAVKDARASAIQAASPKKRRGPEDEWLLHSANLQPEAFERIDHQPPRLVLGIPLHIAQGWDSYAAYYDVLSSASETGVKVFPRMYEDSGTVNRGIIESLINPHPFEPNWEVFHQKLMETDTRLRLASLQILLRRPSAQTNVPVRLAEAGSSYFDPFTGLPMLWSPTQRKLYSVGKDWLDDGGDPTFDISVPAVVQAADRPKNMTARASKSSARARR